jgi:hypothetical protein
VYYVAVPILAFESWPRAVSPVQVGELLVQTALRSKGRALTALRGACTSSKRFSVELADHSLAASVANVRQRYHVKFKILGFLPVWQLHVGGSLASPIREALDQA